MQGVSTRKDGLLVLGATNIPWELDPAIRRRFEKRIYIPLPEAAARATMLRLHLGDTPHTLLPGDFDHLATQCDGFSGSDLSVMVREALMEPLRTCQSAKQFRPVECPGPDGAAQTMLVPCTAYPSCAYCPINVSTKTIDLADCLKCGAKRMTLYDVPSEQLKVPDVSVEDFEHIVNKSRKTVAEEELDQFVEWTREFGQEG